MIMQIDFDGLGRKKIDYYNYLLARKIQLLQHYYPIHLQKFYQKMGFQKGFFPVSAEFYEKSFSYPIYFGLLDSDVEYICKQISSFFEE